MSRETVLLTNDKEKLPSGSTQSPTVKGPRNTDTDKERKKAAEEAKQKEMNARLGIVEGKEAKLDPNSEVGKAVTAFVSQTKEFLSSKEFANIKPDELKKSIRERLIAVLGKEGSDGTPNVDLMFTAGFDKVGQLFIGDGHYTKVLSSMKNLKDKFDALASAMKNSDKAVDKLIASRAGLTYDEWDSLPDDQARFSKLRIPLNKGVEKRSADEMNMSLVEHANKFPERYEWVLASTLIAEKDQLSAKGQVTPSENKRIANIDARLKEVQEDFAKALSAAKGQSNIDAAKKAFNDSAEELNASIVDKDGNSPKKTAIEGSKQDYPQAKYAENGAMVDIDYAKFNSLKSTQRFAAAKESAIASLDKIAAATTNPPIDPRILDAIKNRTSVAIPGQDPKNPSKGYNHLIKAMGLNERDAALLEVVNLTFGARTSVLGDSRISTSIEFRSSFEQQAVYFAGFVDANKERKDVSYNSDDLAGRRGRAITAFGPYGDRGGFGPRYLEDAVAMLKSVAADPTKLSSKEGIRELKKASQEMRLNDALTVGYAYKNGQMHLRDGVFTSRDITRGVLVPAAISFVLGWGLKQVDFGGKGGSSSSNSGGGSGGGSGSSY